MAEGEEKVQKSYFDVLGLCCSSEVTLIERILQPLKGVKKVTVIIPWRTVIVVHDPALISQLDIVKALKHARLEASIRAYGTDKVAMKWPSPYILACGLLLLASLFKPFFRPLQWLALAALVVGLPPIILRSIAAIRRYTLDINILMVIAVGGAVALRDYSEAGFIVFLFTIAEWLESLASHKAGAGMSLLMSMAPQKAVLAETGETVDVGEVKINTNLAVKAGELIPIDGVVTEGSSEVDESSLTGESFPVTKQAESPVWAGTLNIDGYITVRTTALAENSAVAKMARLVEEAQNRRSKTQRLIDHCAKIYTPAVVIIAGSVAVIPLMLRVRNPKHWFNFALVVLVSACPCALVLSTPVGTFCALLTAARKGLLVKGGDVLETLASTRVVALDKTGTITKGEFTVMEFKLISHEVTFDNVLYWVSSIESKSSHPMASALVEYARSNSIEPRPENINEFRIYPGEGVHGEMEGRNIYVGNKRIAIRAGCSVVPNAENMKEGVTLGYVFSGPVPIGIFTLSDTCRTGALEAIKELKSIGVKTAMLTGDCYAAAMHAQDELENTIEMIHAELLPEDKVRIISDLKTKEGCTVMLGDGLNDAPALAMADVGISMGISGSAIAMETSHVTLMSNDIRKIPEAIRLARRTHCKILLNIFFSLITKLAILALAIAGHPLLWAAVLADVGTCLVVIMNSMTLLRTRSSKEKHRHSFQKAHGQCCSSSKSHEFKPICEDGDRCGLMTVSGQSNCGSSLRKRTCHGHEKVDTNDSCEHNCTQRYKTAETEKSECFHDHHTEIAHPLHRDICSMDLVNHSHCSQEPVSHVNNAYHEHTISIINDAECHKEELHDEHSVGRVACCHEVDVTKDRSSKLVYRNQTPEDCIVPMASQISRTAGKKELDLCCGSETNECRSKAVCSSSDAVLGKEKESAFSRNQKIKDCCGGSLNHIKCDPALVDHVSNARHEHHHLLIDSRAACHRDEMHEEHDVGHISCCHQPDIVKDCTSNFLSKEKFTAAHMGRHILQKERSGCCETEGEVYNSKDDNSCGHAYISRGDRDACRSYIRECDVKHGCCAGAIRLPEIVTE